MEQTTQCPNCGGGSIYFHTKGVPGGSYGTQYLGALGSFWRAAKLYPAVCEDCGLTRFFLDKAGRSKLSSSSEWQKPQ